MSAVVCLTARKSRACTSGARKCPAIVPVPALPDFPHPEVNPSSIDIGARQVVRVAPVGRRQPSRSATAGRVIDCADSKAHILLRSWPAFTRGAA